MAGKNSAAASYLDTSFSYPVRDPVWGNIMLSAGFKKIVSSPVLQKMNLHSIKQDMHLMDGMMLKQIK